MRSKSFILYSILSIFLLASCLDGQRTPTEAELSAFGNYVYRLDTTKLQSKLQALLTADTSHWRADQTVRQYYSTPSGSATAASLNSNPSTLNFIWFSRMGVSPDADSIVALLRRELPRNGLDSAAFFLPALASDLDVVHRLAFDSLGIDINQLLPRLDYRLTQAYVRYTAGQRRGFLRPAKLLNNLDFKSGGPMMSPLPTTTRPCARPATPMRASPTSRTPIRQVPSTKPSSASSTLCPTLSSAAPLPSTSSAAAGRCRSCPPADGASWSTSRPSSSGPSPRTPS